MPQGTLGLQSQARPSFGWLDNWELLGRTRVQPRTGNKNPFRAWSFSHHDSQTLQWFGAQSMWHALGSTCALDGSGLAWQLHMVGSWDKNPSGCMLTIPSVIPCRYGLLRAYVVGQRLIALWGEIALLHVNYALSVILLLIKQFESVNRVIICSVRQTSAPQKVYLEN